MLKPITLFFVVGLGVLASLTTTTTTTYVRAGNEWNDSCRDSGYGAGRDGPFSRETYDHCGEEEGGDDAYYNGFINGCMSIEGNTRDVCESATDS
jgi:hypothetical protein